MLSSTDRNLPPTLAKLTTKVESQEMWLPILCGGNKSEILLSAIYPKPLFGENLQLKPIYSV